VYHRGKLVVDLAGGLQDPASGEPYSRETLQPIFSAAKGITALAVNMLGASAAADSSRSRPRLRRHSLSAPCSTARSGHSKAIPGPESSL
jgi:hypothetical protein